MPDGRGPAPRRAPLSIIRRQRRPLALLRECIRSCFRRHFFVLEPTSPFRGRAKVVQLCCGVFRGGPPPSLSPPTIWAAFFFFAILIVGRLKLSLPCARPARVAVKTVPSANGRLDDRFVWFGRGFARGLACWLRLDFVLRMGGWGNLSGLAPIKPGFRRVEVRSLNAAEFGSVSLLVIAARDVGRCLHAADCVFFCFLSSFPFLQLRKIPTTRR